MHLPNLVSKSVLDIGSWDGYFSFAAERLGARKVISLDHYVWSLDFTARYRYEMACRSQNVTPAPWETVPEIWKPDELPGKACYDLAHVALGSKCEAVVGDFMALDAKAIGKADVVFFLGVLYHVRDPFGAIERVAALTNELAVIETVIVYVAGYDRFPLWRFYQGDELADDPTNYWVPNLQALKAMCLAAGFTRVEANPTPLKTRARQATKPGSVVGSRGVVRAWK